MQACFHIVVPTVLNLPSSVVYDACSQRESIRNMERIMLSRELYFGLEMTCLLHLRTEQAKLAAADTQLSNLKGTIATCAALTSKAETASALKSENLELKAQHEDVRRNDEELREQLRKAEASVVEKTTN
ncbi:hypothetical protein C8R44DRAFT_211133 [Mycena epipterygia]|nr:hypothetical protein C8R44DRAFT_211133 [Mycena epipterygia]